MLPFREIFQLCDLANETAGLHQFVAEGKSRTGFFKQAKKAYPMFPFSEDKIKWDEYGEIINK
ncbi:hypothetical protein KUTeg_014253 [Tegillarca granosa]|uniref:Uncharacterized protein n=1 Tax=Tegillarca granosa TaxID=220873 RepID=A0ABQ9EW20_TEGGR|nr:hypothetical protein KUTeg_014253 [Tegillarca granosa]